MSVDPDHQAPPPYEPPAPTEIAMQTLIDCVQNTVNREYGSQDEDPDETKRLREFLLYCLAVDYRVGYSVTLSASDREHYLEVCEVIWATERMYRPTILAEQGGVSRVAQAFGPYLWKYLHAPCMRLGIPVEAATLIALRYVKYLNVSGTYKGRVYGILHNNGPADLAMKLSIDRRILIPRLAKSSQMRLDLHESLTEIAQSYFKSIDGVSSEVRPSGFGQDVKFAEVKSSNYVLTKRGHYYAIDRGMVLHKSRRSTGLLFEGTLGCELGLKSRSSELFESIESLLRERYKDLSPRHENEAQQDCKVGPAPSVAAGITLRESSVWSMPPH